MFLNVISVPRSAAPYFWLIRAVVPAMAERSKRPHMSASLAEFQSLVKTYDNKEAA